MAQHDYLDPTTLPPVLNVFKNIGPPDTENVLTKTSREQLPLLLKPASTNLWLTMCAKF